MCGEPLHGDCLQRNSPRGFLRNPHKLPLAPCSKLLHLSVSVSKLTSPVRSSPRGFLRNPHSLPRASCAIHCQCLLAQASLDKQTLSMSCGETGIRTPETLLEFTRFPGVPLQPLEHLSIAVGNECLRSPRMGIFSNRLQNYCFFTTYARICAFFCKKYFILAQKGGLRW